MISLNASDASELSYIIFPEYGVKMLIVSGSTRSFIDPNIAQNVPKFNHKRSICCFNSFSKISHKHSVDSSFQNFNLQNPMNLKFTISSNILKVSSAFYDLNLIPVDPDRASSKDKTTVLMEKLLFRIRKSIVVEFPNASQYQKIILHNDNFK
nr:unnamed protein product [Callosobruchus chinensis]